MHKNLILSGYMWEHNPNLKREVQPVLEDQSTP